MWGEERENVLVVHKLGHSQWLKILILILGRKFWFRKQSSSQSSPVTVVNDFGVGNRIASS